jgi:non-ribosomal peptide synthase protein (TIGR01720 family)
VSPPLPRDWTDGRNDESSARVAWCRLEPDETRRLLHDPSRANGRPTSAVLVAASARVLARWARSDSVRIDFEGTGRGDYMDEIDVSRTVGWFTTMTPLRLALPDSMGRDDLVDSVANELRSQTPGNVAYGSLRYLSGRPEVRAQFAQIRRAEVVFAYLGPAPSVSQDSSIYEEIGPSHAPHRSPRAIRPYLLDVTSRIREGRLETSWTYSGNVHRAESIEAIADAFLAEVRALVDGRGPRPRAAVLPGVPTFVDLGADERGLLSAEHPDAVAVHPLSPLQQLIVLVPLDRSSHVLQRSQPLEGPTDAESLRAA